MPIKVKLKNKDGLIQNLKGLDVKDGFCKFPFCCFSTTPLQNSSSKSCHLINTTEFLAAITRLRL